MPDVPEWKIKISGHAITGSGQRKKPTAAQRAEILERQRGRCLYCGIKIGTTVNRRSDVVILKLNWDHFIPYAYGQTNPGSNWVAACHICNGIKGPRMFETVARAQKFIKARWIEKGYELPASTGHLDQPPSRTVPEHLAPYAYVIARRFRSAGRPMYPTHILGQGGSTLQMREAMAALISSGYLKREAPNAMERPRYILRRAFPLPVGCDATFSGHQKDLQAASTPGTSQAISAG